MVELLTNVGDHLRSRASGRIGEILKFGHHVRQAAPGLHGFACGRCRRSRHWAHGWSAFRGRDAGGGGGGGTLCAGIIALRNTL